MTTEDRFNPFQVGDVVVHKPSGERGVVCAVEGDDKTIIIAPSMHEWCFGKRPSGGRLMRWRKLREGATGATCFAILALFAARFVA